MTKFLTSLDSFNMDISNTVRDRWGLFTHESVMNALVRDLSSSSSTSPAFGADERFTCLVILNSGVCLSSHELEKLSQSMRDTYMDASCKKPLTLLPNNAGAGDGDVIDVKCCKSDCFYCQITTPKSIRASILDCIQSLEKSTDNLYNQFNNDHFIFSNGLIKLVQSLKDTRITSLNLGDNEIHSDLMIDLAQFLHSTQIKSLDLSGNCIQAKGFDYLNKVLRETQISSLNISKNGSMHAVIHVKRPYRFSYLFTENKEILRKSLADIFDKSASKYLDLSCNSNPVNHRYVASIVKNSKIEHLDLAGLSIDMKIFAPNLVDSSINTLNLAGCKLGTDGIKILASVLKNTNIQSLDLSDTNINCECLEVFAPYLVESQIAYLNLSKNRFDRDGINSLAIVLPNTRIVSLDLNYCFIGNRSIKILSACLVHTKITSLGFKGNVPNDYDTKSLAVGVKDSQISSIDLGSNEAVDMVHLLSLCMVGSKLTSITLSECRIDCSVMEDLVITLRNTNTTSINLIGTYMTCGVMRIFVSCLVNSKITHLRLSNEELDIDAVECLSVALRNSQISSLDLSRNGLDCDSLKVLAPCLVDTKLQHLNLEENKLDLIKKYYFDEKMRNYEGVECLVLALKKSQIINLNLANNALTCKSLMNLILSLPDTKITTLDLSGNELFCNVFYLANVLKSTQISSLALRKIRRNRTGSNTSHYKVTNTYYKELSGMQCTFRLHYLVHMNPLQAEKIMVLNLSRNKISCCAKLKELCQFLSNSQIISLNLSDNRINCDGVYYLAQVLQSTKISSLNLASNEISTNGVQHLVLKLPGSQLKSLDLSHNLITDKSIECLCGNLAYTKYADLKLRGNKIGRQAVDHLCKNVAEINVQFDLPNDDFSHHIDLYKYPGCVIEIYQTSFGKGIDHVNKYVCDKTDITKVYIRSRCENGLHFFRDLAKIVSNINISEIEMEESSRFPYSVFANFAQLKCNGTRSWFTPVVLNRLLIELKFQNIKKNCFQDLVKLCLNNIMYLDLSHIDMEEDKFIFFAQALKYNTMDQNKNYLISLNLSNNKLGAKSAKLLAEVLPYNIPSLTYIDLHSNNIGYSGFKSLMEVVDKTSLCWLSLGDNNIEDQLQETIELSPYIVPRKGDETPVAFQVRYLFRQLVSLNTCSGELEFTIPTTDSNPPVNITHYPKLLKIYSAFENDVKYLNVQVYDNYYMKSKRHDRRLLEKIEKFGNEIEKRFLSFIDSISNQTKLEQAFGYDSFVVLVKECERLELNECVESLLLHRVLYYVDDDEEILHPFIYRMMHKYSMPLFCEQIEPNKREQIIAYYQNHPEIEEVEALIDLLTSMSTEEN